MRRSPELDVRLRSYEGLLRAFAAPLGLVGPRDLSGLWERHILDSLRALPCLRPEDEEIIDVGSGAGLPGIPLALAEPGRSFLLVESSRRRAGFLELAVEELDLPNAKVLLTRVEDLETEADACLVRAFAPPLEAWSACSRLLNRRGHVIYYAGSSWNRDIEAMLGQAGVSSPICSSGERAGEGPVVTMSPIDARRARR